MEGFNSVITFLVSLTVFPFLINSLSFNFFFVAHSVAFKRMSAPLLLVALCLYFTGTISPDMCNSMIFPFAPELMQRPNIKTKG